jgi:chromosome segregation ATPase
MNKRALDDLKRQETDLDKSRDQLTIGENNLKELINEIEIKKRNLSVLAKELSIKQNKINAQKNELESRRKKLDVARNEFTNKNNDLKNNENIFRTVEENEKRILKENEDLEKEVKKKREELEKKVNEMYEKSKQLYALREQEAHLLGDINNLISAEKNIMGNLKRKSQEIDKQNERMYNVDFQIQLMEKKIAWHQGKRTPEETNEINQKIAKLSESRDEELKKKNTLSESLKTIDEDLRTVDNQLKTLKEEKKRLTENIEELELENIKCGQDLTRITKKKEDTLVQHDLMKLEIKKLHDKLLDEVNKVFKEENKLYQLELSIKEREKEITVHKDILVAEHKASEEERHKVAIELSQKLIRCNNLKLKYESIVQRNKKSNDDNNDIGEHSQAYYVVKTAQEKEELQRQSILS